MSGFGEIDEKPQFEEPETEEDETAWQRDFVAHMGGDPPKEKEDPYDKSGDTPAEKGKLTDADYNKRFDAINEAIKDFTPAELRNLTGEKGEKVKKMLRDLSAEHMKQPDTRQEIDRMRDLADKFNKYFQDKKLGLQVSEHEEEPPRGSPPGTPGPWSLRFTRAKR